MRKQIIEPLPHKELTSNQGWVDLEKVSRVELTSEEQDYPIEAALALRAGSGWRAASTGPQVNRLHFDKPLSVSCIKVYFKELEQARTHEFVLSWLAEEGRTFREILRQQYTFSPPGTTCQLEVYQVDLRGVAMLELMIVPDINNILAYASLSQLRLR
jgi:hypothetical protein